MFDEAGEITYSVGELAAAINQTLQRGFGDGVWVRGEIQSWSDRGKHSYFTLTDDSGEARAVLNVQLFAYARNRLRPLLERHQLRLADGISVRIFGHLDFWAEGGRLGLKMTGIDPRFTLGELALARDEILRRLQASGHVDANRARPLSPVPLRVGVVTSVGSAAWHDFRDEIEASRLGFHLAVVDTRVQGQGADHQVSRALSSLADRADLDVIVLIRGGGARNDLATFDAESIAWAILRSRIPVVTGLGHEVDRSVADEVAHLSVKTPTACAGLLIDRVRAYQSACESSWRSICSVATGELVGARAAVGDRAHRIARRTHAAVERADVRVGSRAEALGRRAPLALAHAGRHLDRAAATLAARPGRLLDDERRGLDAIAARIAARDPAVLLARGWSITHDPSGAVVRSVSDAPPGSLLRTRVADGSITSRVEPAESNQPSRRGDPRE